MVYREVDRVHHFRSFGAVVFGFFIFGVGIVTTALGLVKSNKLDRVRVQIKRQNAVSEQVYNSFARSNPSQGMTSDEFNVMSGQVGPVLESLSSFSGRGSDVQG